MCNPLCFFKKSQSRLEIGSIDRPAAVISRKVFHLYLQLEIHFNISILTQYIAAFSKAITLGDELGT
jgi:hypothetical protein